MLCIIVIVVVFVIDWLLLLIVVKINTWTCGHLVFYLVLLYSSFITFTPFVQCHNVAYHLKKFNGSPELKKKQ